MAPSTTVRMSHSDGGFYVPITFLPYGAVIDVGHSTDREGVLGLWRATVEASGTGEDRALGIATYALGVQRVVRVVFEAPGA